MPKGWEIDFWKDIIRYHDSKITLKEIENKYKNNVIIAQLSISSPRILKRFDKFNTNNSKNQIKPFNFINVGIGYRKDNGSDNAIIPAIPYTKLTKTVKYMPFVDYKTGKYYENNTQYYWKPLSEMFLDYINHKEEKYDGNIGTLSRKKITVDKVIHIGKESNNLDESEIIGVSDSDYVIYDNVDNNRITSVIQKMKSKDARRIGLSKRHLFRLKKRLKRGLKIELRKKTLRKILSYS